jgi:hypothetical protein
VFIGLVRVLEADLKRFFGFFGFFGLSLDGILDIW